LQFSSFSHRRKDLTSFSYLPLQYALLSSLEQSTQRRNSASNCPLGSSRVWNGANVYNRRFVMSRNPRARGFPYDWWPVLVIVGLDTLRMEYVRTSAPVLGRRRSSNTAGGNMSDSSPWWHRQDYPVQQHSRLCNTPCGYCYHLDATWSLGLNAFDLLLTSLKI